MNDPARPQTFSYSAVWEDAGRMLRANGGLLSAIAGVFLFLPALLLARYAPQPEQPETWREMVEMTSAYVTANWPWLLAGTLVNMIGVIAMYLLLLGTPRLTVGRAVARALPILPFFYIVFLIQNVGLVLGLAAFLIGVIFMLGKLILAPAILVIEAPAAPITAVQRAWERAGSRSWAIGGLVAIYYAAATFISFAIQASLGTMILLLLGRDGIGGLLLSIIGASVGTAISLIGTVLIAAIYRAVTLTPNAARAL